MLYPEGKGQEIEIAEYHKNQKTIFIVEYKLFTLLMSLVYQMPIAKKKH